MWETIKYVTSAFSLTAFIVAAIVTVIRAQLNRTERLIRTAAEKDRPDAIREALRTIETPTAGLSPADQAKLALVQIHNKSRRFLITATVIVLLAIIAAIIAIVALVLENANSPISPPRTEPGEGSETNRVALTPAVSLTPAPKPSFDPTLQLNLESAAWIFPKSGISDPNQYAAQGYPIISDDSVKAITNVLVDESITNKLKPFFPAGSLNAPASTEITLEVWDDSGGFPDTGSVKITGDLDEAHVNQVVSTLESVKFPSPAPIPYTPKLPGVVTPQDIQNAPTHVSYYLIKVKLEALDPEHQ